MPHISPHQLALTYAGNDIPITQFVYRDDQPAAPYMTPTQAAAVVRWYSMGLDVCARWALMYGPLETECDPVALVSTAAQILEKDTRQ